MVSMDRVIFGYGYLRQADFSALAAASTACHANFTYSDPFIFISAECVCAAQFLAFNAGLSCHFQANFCADSTDHALFFVRLEGSYFQVRIGDVRLTNDRAITASRASVTATNLSTVGQDDGDATLYAVVRVYAQAIHTNSIASGRYGRQFYDSNIRSRGENGLERRELSARQAGLAFRQANFSTDVNGSTTAQVAASATIDLERRFKCLNGS